MTESHASQQQMDVRTENEILVRGHVRRRKPEGEARARRKPYPTKWGRGKAYIFEDARTITSYENTPLMARLRIALAVLRGKSVRNDGRGTIIAAAGTKPRVVAMSSVHSPSAPRPGDESVIGEGSGT